MFGIGDYKMSNRTESVLKDFCKKVSDSTITNPVNTDYDKLFEMLDDDYGKTGADKKKIGVVITQEELNKLEAKNQALLTALEEIVSKLSYYKNEHGISEYDTDIIIFDSINLIAEAIQGDE